MIPAALALAAVLGLEAAGGGTPRPSALPISSPGAPGPSPRPSAALDLSAPSRRPDPSIYEVHPSVDVPVTIVAASFGLARELFKNQLTRISCPCDPSKLNVIDRGTVGNHSHAASLAGDLTAYGVPSLLPLLDLVDIGPHRAFAEDLLVYAEALAVDTAVQNTADFVFARPRPRTYAGDPAYVNAAEGYLSFYAGHVATVFAALSTASYTIRRRYGERIWPWIVTGLIGGSVAFDRVASGHHFPTDVAVAAVAGTAFGIGIPWLHVRTRRAHVELAPIPFAGGSGLGLVGAF